MRRAIVNFTHGTLYNGVPLKKAELRELNGHDQEGLLEQEPLFSVARIHKLLANVVDFGNGVDPKEKQRLLNSLTIGDFAALVLELRRLTSGDILRCIIACPACKQDMSTDIPITQMLQQSKNQPIGNRETEIGGFSLKLRPVTRADLYSVGDSDNPEEQLARLCILDANPRLPEKLDASFISEISIKLAELDSQADILLGLTCPNCSHKFQTPFYPEEFFLLEIDAKKTQLEGEVHWLAFNYHWSEDEILSLPLSKRRKYVDLINQTLSGENA
jgi:hypothetical protein